MNSATIAFRVKPEIKRRADNLFSRLGMSTSTGMNILLMQTLAHRGFPFPIQVSDENEHMPNAETRAILDRDMAGLEPSYGPFDSTEEMLKAALDMED
jgi:addiction module RelB/DinJ family antitoxin